MFLDKSIKRPTDLFENPKTVEVEKTVFSWVVEQQRGQDVDITDFISIVKLPRAKENEEDSTC